MMTEFSYLFELFSYLVNFNRNELGTVRCQIKYKHAYIKLN